ncbi:Fibroblast growth factor receptor-like 1 [Acanthosepion pharaonis]|uniref:Fibroblast growth factor receptor-like 1 n=1 Tax=Acanthosepion pharaonis TaxID=158019 RepID=A0A812E1A2_ACAPH|nr:Fibroblast growth factor receptor-like 1 [Sepia pharaonis]
MYLYMYLLSISIYLSIYHSLFTSIFIDPAGFHLRIFFDRDEHGIVKENPACIPCVTSDGPAAFILLIFLHVDEHGDVRKIRHAFRVTSFAERKERIQQNNLYPNQHDPEGGAEPKFIHLNKMKQNKIPRPVGSSIRFKCKATGIPQPEVRWLKDGQIWVSEDVGSYQDSRLRWTLKINDLQEKDSGKYTCIVTNLHGSINYTYTLEVVEKVHDKPEFLPPHPLNQTVRHGQQASFQCHVKSDAQPHITVNKIAFFFHIY